MDNEDYSINSINLKKIASDSQFCSITRMTAAQLLKTPYLTLKDFFEGLSNNDITVLLFMADEVERNNDYLKDLLVLAEMLARAEGADPMNLQDSTNNLNYLCGFIVAESLYRKGLVQIFRENMSFGDDAADKIVVKPVDGMDYSRFM